MFKKFIKLEWKAFTRSAAFSTNLVVKIIVLLYAIMMAFFLLLLGTGAFSILKKAGASDPMLWVNKYLIYYIVVDLGIRIVFQNIPVSNIKPLLTLNIKKKTIVNFTIGKSMATIFNILHAFFFVPFSIVLLVKGYNPVNVVLWHVSIMALLYSNNFLNILLEGKNWLFAVFIVLLATFGGLQYYGYFDITTYTEVFFTSLYSTYFMALLPIALLVIVWRATFKFFYEYMFLDAGLKTKEEEARTENYAWLDQFGSMSTYLKNDLKLILRNKRAKMTVISSVLFLFYGLLFFSNSIEVYNTPTWKMFAAIMLTSGFMFTFGQFVPSWDSSYYPLMMSQNIPYREYIASKWWLMVIATVITTILASFYLYFGVDVYLMILACAVYNIGINAYMVLLSGAFVKTPVDLTKARQAMGGQKSFNPKMMLLGLSKLIIPIVLYAIGHYIFNDIVAYVLIAGTGVIGLLFRNFVFNQIARLYKSEKYDTLAAYKQVN